MRCASASDLTVSVSAGPCKLTSAWGRDEHGVRVRSRTYWKQLTCRRNWCSYGCSLCWKWNKEVYVSYYSLTVDNIFILRAGNWQRCYNYYM